MTIHPGVFYKEPKSTTNHKEENMTKIKKMSKQEIINTLEGALNKLDVYPNYCEKCGCPHVYDFDDTCDHCGASLEEEIECPTCNGAGFVPISQLEGE